MRSLTSVSLPVRLGTAIPALRAVTLGLVLLVAQATAVPLKCTAARIIGSDGLKLVVVREARLDLVVTVIDGYWGVYTLQEGTELVGGMPLMAFSMLVVIRALSLLLLELQMARIST
jgi:hypothetical protein